MTKLRLLTTAMVAIVFTFPLTGHSQAVTNIQEMVAGGDVSLSLRYRYELVDQEGISKNANASTLKSRLTYKSAEFNGFKATLEFNNVTVVGDENYRTPTNGNTAYPIVADPVGNDLNQALLSYSGGKYSAALGRQRVLHGDQRFVGGVGFRQNEQTYDAITLSSKALGPISLNYSYLWGVNRIFGPKDSAVQAKKWDSNSHILYAKMTPSKGQAVNAYAYFLDFANAAANSSRTLGISYSAKLDPFSVKAAYATQSDYGDNPNDYQADYIMAEITAPWKPVKVSLGYEVLGSDAGTAAFKTPLATLHKFQGWADKFLATPAAGIQDTYLKLAGKLGSTKVALFYHEFDADFGSASLGSEWDLVATYPIKKGISAQLKYATYSADAHASDTDKLWLTFSAKF